jgi:nitroimidazol reductase NimA-like FMN-containing flavoprotein (pyridoxamine 5'-phosphate oxidase superfamily)
VIPPTAERFLHEHTRTFLLSVRPDGAPTCHPMVGFWRGGALYLNTYRRSAKARNIMGASRVACVVVTNDDDPRFRGVVLRGHAEILPARAPDPERQAADAPRPAGVGAEVARLVETQLAEGKRVMIRVVPDEVRLVGEHP